MKRVIFSLSLCLCMGFASMAQDVEEYNAAYANKRGVYLLPQKGDFALGVDATPFLRYLGNFFSSSGNSAPLFNGVDQTIYGKYFVRDNRAIRARLTLNLLNDTEKGFVRDDEEFNFDPSSIETLLDVQHTSNTDVELGIGYEFRRGNGRVQGFWGFEAAFGFNSGQKRTLEYGNPIDVNVDQPTPTRPSTYQGFTNIWDYYDSRDRRLTEEKDGSVYSAGLGIFVGVEYFFAPQISIGGEFGLGARAYRTGQDKKIWESWSTITDNLQSETVRPDNWNDVPVITVGTRTSGRIFLMFHF